jgi:hypothetical protein
MGKGRAVAIELTKREQRELVSLTRKHGAPQAVAERARIVLAAVSGLKSKDIASKLGLCTHTVGTRRNRFAERRMDGLYDEPRPGPSLKERRVTSALPVQQDLPGLRDLLRPSALPAQRVRPESPARPDSELFAQAATREGARHNAATTRYCLSPIAAPTETQQPFRTIGRHRAVYATRTIRG